MTNHQEFFQAAANIAQDATCYRAKCGTVVVKDDEIIGSGYNSPPRDDESQRMCENEWDNAIKPKYDTTCCVHAEWRAILDACKSNADKIGGATLYFMRVDENGEMTGAGVPYCTTCSRLAMESGIVKFALWNSGAQDIYDIGEYNQASYAYHERKEDV